MKHLVFVAALFLLTQCANKDVVAPAPHGPVPSPAQMEWHRMEMNAFIHFTINTFTDLEWGMGGESPNLFSPTDFDADQWTQALSDAGFKGVILTCKHHDGFCLWPSEFTEHSVKNSPFENGQGDIVKAVAAACQRRNLKFGIYVSPWDRNHPAYGTDEYIVYYRKQLKELFVNYGPIFEMWFDGANGGTGYYGGSNERRTINGSSYYDWPGTLDSVRRLEPDVIFFSDAGPGVRWVGNERGVAGETNWNRISTDTLFAGKAGIEQLLNTGHPEGENWVPAETDVSIRPGWFYHAKEDSLVKSPEKLFDIYLTSVGRGSTLLLNVPPDRRGLIHENDLASLKGFRALLDEAFAVNLADGASATADSWRGQSDMFDVSNVLDGDSSTYWATDDDKTTGTITIALKSPQMIRYVVLQEYIPLGQRVAKFDLEYLAGGDWLALASATTIGYKRIIRVDPVEASAIRVSIRESQACPLIESIRIY